MTVFSEAKRIIGAKAGAYEVSPGRWIVSDERCRSVYLDGEKSLPCLEKVETGAGWECFVSASVSV